MYQYKNCLPFIQRILNSSIHSSTNALADALSRLCPNLTEIALPLRTTELELLPTSSSSLTVSALTAIHPASDDQLEYIQMCHNAFVGHNGVDRTLTRLLSLQQVWLGMGKEEAED